MARRLKGSALRVGIVLQGEGYLNSKGIETETR